MVKEISFKDKNFIITGGANGVGYELVNEIIKHEGKVIVIDNDVESLKNLKQLNESSQHLDTYNCDIANFDKLGKVLENIDFKYKKIDGLVHYAGITTIATITETTFEQYNEVLNINLMSGFFISKFIISKMIKMSLPCSIVFIGSPHYEGGHADRAIYAISKGALYTLSEHISRNYSQNQIRSNYLVLGWTLTKGEVKLREKNKQDLSEILALANELVPMGRMCETNESIDAIIYLLSESSKMVTGSVIKAAGGLRI